VIQAKEIKTANRAVVWWNTNTNASDTSLTGCFLIDLSLVVIMANVLVTTGQ
jgi:hypothetical protein